MPIEVRGLAPLLQVFAMPASIAFYRDVLGFVIKGTDGKPVPHNDWVLLELNGAQLMLNTAYERDQRPAAPDAARMAAHDDTCIYFGCPDVDAAYTYLRDKGVNLKPPKVAPYGMKQLYLHDPDGYNLCFQWRADTGQGDERELGR
jgi:catechol 2,3-dioxygenase-like lactoylglutathione lyase family enzyme